MHDIKKLIFYTTIVCYIVAYTVRLRVEHYKNEINIDKEQHFMKGIYLLSFATFIFTGSWSQWNFTKSNYGFLKTSIKPFYIVGEDSVSTVLLTRDSYFNVGTEDSSKVLVIAYGYERGKLLNASNYVDTFKIALIKSLPVNKRRSLIQNAFAKYRQAFNRKIKTEFGYYLYEGIYSPIRREFVYYWLETKDSGLLNQWFEIIELAEEDIDGLTGRAVAQLFLLASTEFCNELRKQKQKRKEAVVSVLRDGIQHYCKTDEEVNHWINLLKLKLNGEL